MTEAKTLRIPIEQLEIMPPLYSETSFLDENPNVMEREQLEKFKELVKGGVTRVDPIIVMKYEGRYYVIDGHKRYELLREENVKYVDVTYIGEAKNLEDLYLNTIRRTVIRGNIDWLKLARVVAELVKKGHDMQDILTSIGLTDVTRSRLTPVVTAIVRSLDIGFEKFSSYNSLVLYSIIGKIMLQLSLVAKEYPEIIDKLNMKFDVMIESSKKYSAAVEYLIGQLEELYHSLNAFVKSEIEKKRLENIEESKESKQREASYLEHDEEDWKAEEMEGERGGWSGVTPDIPTTPETAGDDGVGETVSYSEEGGDGEIEIIQVDDHRYSIDEEVMRPLYVPEYTFELTCEACSERLGSITHGHDYHEIKIVLEDGSIYRIMVYRDKVECIRE